jgi:hypothetical protein
MRSIRIVAALCVVALAAGVMTAAASAKPSHPAKRDHAAKRTHAVKAIRAAKPARAADDGDVVLPSRVSNAITRAQNLINAVGVSIDAGNTTQATAELSRVDTDVLRVSKAARAQMNAPADPNAETTPGPDSVVAALTFEQGAVTTLAGYFDGKSGTLVSSLKHSLFSTMNTRDALLNAVIALDPEGAGADYADGMADTVAGYDDEVANISEALANDALSAGGKGVLTAALKQSRATDSKVNTAFGGGE